MGYAIRLELENERVVVVGAGSVATRRVRRLVDEGAEVVVVAPDGTDELEDRARRGEIEWRRRRYEPSDLEGARLAFAATDVGSVQSAVAEEAADRGIPVNTADRSTRSDFSVPAVAEVGSIRLSIDTGGASPALSAALRRHLEETIDPGWARGAGALARLRETAVAEMNPSTRRRFFRELVADLPDALPDGSDERLDEWLAGAADRAELDAEARRAIVARVLAE